jgi:hypothetical protein
MRGDPVLFGNRRFQALLKTIHLDGVIRLLLVTQPLDLTGLVAAASGHAHESSLTFDTRHPAYGLLRAVLSDSPDSPASTRFQPPPPYGHTLLIASARSPTGTP